MLNLSSCPSLYRLGSPLPGPGINRKLGLKGLVRENVMLTRSDCLVVKKSFPVEDRSVVRMFPDGGMEASPRTPLFWSRSLSRALSVASSEFRNTESRVNISKNQTRLLAIKPTLRQEEVERDVDEVFRHRSILARLLELITRISRDN